MNSQNNDPLIFYLFYVKLASFINSIFVDVLPAENYASNCKVKITTGDYSPLMRHVVNNLSGAKVQEHAIKTQPMFYDRFISLCAMMNGISEIQ